MEIGVVFVTENREEIRVFSNRGGGKNKGFGPKYLSLGQSLNDWLLMIVHLDIMVCAKCSDSKLRRWQAPYNDFIHNTKNTQFVPKDIICASF